MRYICGINNLKVGTIFSQPKLIFNFILLGQKRTLRSNAPPPPPPTSSSTERKKKLIWDPDQATSTSPRVKHQRRLMNGKKFGEFFFFSSRLLLFRMKRKHNWIRLFGAATLTRDARRVWELRVPFRCRILDFHTHRAEGAAILTRNSSHKIKFVINKNCVLCSSAANRCFARRKVAIEAKVKPKSDYLLI